MVKQDKKGNRTFSIGENTPDRKFVSNRISTAKYNVFSFFPRFLFEQFRKYSNLFFLFIIILQQIPGVSPTGQYTTAIPMTFILTVSAIKEIIEDWKRHRQDDAINKRRVQVLRNKSWQSLKWTEVRVGDVVKVLNDEFFPADLVLLSSSEPQGMCYIETANLDGETNLKIRQGLPCTFQLVTLEAIGNLRGKIECEPPNRHLYEFAGNIIASEINLPTATTTTPLGSNQVLLRGAQLRNTPWVCGVVIYTGHESKLMLNSKSVPLKRSNVEKITNNQIIMLFIMLLVLCTMSIIGNIVWANHHLTTDWYIGFGANYREHFGLNFLTFMILYNNLIPISLPVTLEVVKFVQAFYINWDLEMYHEDTNTPAGARTSNLNEELGMVQYVFTDKTGTLTRNVMEMKMLSIGGKKYGKPPTQTEEDELEIFRPADLIHDIDKGDQILAEFLIGLAVCHTVVPEKENLGEIKYQASSPDESALVKGIARLGIVFLERSPETVTIDFRGQHQVYQILNVLEFTSDRKRMSVIVRTPEGELKLFCKGADSAIFERLAPKQDFQPITYSHLEDFAILGLRTLCIAVAELAEDDYASWRRIYYEASISIDDRDKNLADTAELIERNLYLLGATAIEDKLQMGVPEAIASMLKADIKVWILTGDKQETAVNIGHSCRLLQAGFHPFVMTESTLDGTRAQLRAFQQKIESTASRETEKSLVIEGKTLLFALTPDLRMDFFQLAHSCKSVICCRVSPSQKAEVVELVKSRSKAITLAIGDGANDVAMIQAAHIGIGITGVEGLQAACAADYTIAQFRFLVNLLFVHGARNYKRLVDVILYSFYKNICLYVIQVWFAFQNGFSGQILFEKWCIGFYNVFFTSAPPGSLGLLNFQCSKRSRLNIPTLYKDSQSRRHFNIKVFWQWAFNGIYHSLLLYWLPVFFLKHDAVFGTGLGGDNFFLGNIVYTFTVVTVCLKAALITTAWDFLTHIAIWGSILLWFVFLAIYSQVWKFVPFSAEMYGLAQMIYSCPAFWLSLFLVPLACLLRDFVWTSLRRTVSSSLVEHVQEQELKNEDPSLYITLQYKRSKSQENIERTKMLTGMMVNDASSMGVVPSQQPTETLGFAFSQEEHGAVSQAQLIRCYDSRMRKPDL